MKKRIFAYFFACLAFTAFFLLFSFVYLAGVRKRDVSKQNLSEPYYTGPKAAGLLFTVYGGKGCFVYLDFKGSKTRFTLTENANQSRIDDMPVNYVINSDYNLLSGIVDRAGGIELSSDGETLRYTGEQTVELLAQNPDDTELRINIITAIFHNISKNGFSNDDFVYIIENSGTDLLFPDCFYWQDYIQKTAGNVEVIE